VIFPVQAMNVSYMLSYENNLESVDLTNANLNGITSINGWFKGDSKLTSVNLSGANLSNVTNVSELFCDATNLEEVKLDNSQWGEIA
jgi:surface protein